MRDKSRRGRNEIPEVTGKQIEVLGKRLLGRRVKMSDCQFLMVSLNTVHWVEETVANFEQDIIEEEPEGWIGFVVSDARGNIFGCCFASMEKMGEFVTSIDRRTQLSMEGVVFWIAGAPGKMYGLMVDEIVVIGELDELEW